MPPSTLNKKDRQPKCQLRALQAKIRRLKLMPSYRPAMQEPWAPARTLPLPNPWYLTGSARVRSRKLLHQHPNWPLNRSSNTRIWRILTWEAKLVAIPIWRIVRKRKGSYIPAPSATNASGKAQHWVDTSQRLIQASRLHIITRNAFETPESSSVPYTVKQWIFTKQN